MSKQEQQQHNYNKRYNNTNRRGERNDHSQYNNQDANNDNNWRRGGGEEGRLKNYRGRGQGQQFYQRGRAQTGARGRTHQDFKTLEPQESKSISKIIGICDQMCPRSEIILREREGLLHKFEIIHQDPQESSWPVQETSNIGVDNKKAGRNQARRKTLPKADITKTIKSFARSAAGQDKTLLEDLRPVRVLKETVTYLCQEILPRTDYPFNFIYDFIFDRLRAIRQDLVIQRIEDVDAIHILEIIVKFHIYSEFRLREEDISIYDPHINQKHLVDCLRKLLTLYEFNNYSNPSRAEFEALNCLVSINSYDAITRAFSLKKKISSTTLNISIDMALSYQCKNFVRFFRKMIQLPCILQMYCVRHVSVMRGYAYNIMAMAYGVNACKIPLPWITTQLLYPSVSETHRDLGHVEVEILRDKDEKYAKFQKSQASVIQSKVAGIRNTKFQSPHIQSIMTRDTKKLPQLMLEMSL